MPPKIDIQASPACPGATFLNAPSCGIEYGRFAEATAPVASIAPSSANDSPMTPGNCCQSPSSAQVSTVTRTVYGRVISSRASARARTSRYASRVEEIVMATIQNAEVSCPNWLYIWMPSIPAAKHAK